MDSSSGPRSGPVTGTPAARMPTGQLVIVAALIAIPILALMWVSSYAKREPELWGLPFFYWYQFCWVFVTAILTSIAYRIVVAYERRRRHLGSPGTVANRWDDEPDRWDDDGPVR